MIYKATKAIDAAFKENGLKHKVNEQPSFSAVEAGFSGDNCTFTVHFVSQDDDCDVKVLTQDFAKFPGNKLTAGYEIINSLNKKYRYAKFVLDPSDGGVHAEYDFPVKLNIPTVKEVAVEIALRFMKIIDDAYPEIMKAIWS